MSISYHGVVGHKSKVTLPSAEMYYTNMNILRDPPKSIMTRKIDKVGETSEITQMIQESGDRACESIMTYARGVNPMVSVSYNNYGNNGGQRVNAPLPDGRGGQAYLPYRILDKGAFRPPQRDQRDLYPLSRLPRVWTSSFTQPGFADFSKKTICQGTDENTKGVKKPGQMLKACVRPTATYKLETPIVENYEVKNVIKNPLHVRGDTGKRSEARLNLYIPSNPVKEIVENPMHAIANPNLGNSRMRKDMDLSSFNTEKYTHELLEANANTNASRNIQITTIDELYGMNTDEYTREAMNISADSGVTGNKKYDYLSTEMDLDRVLPYHEARTNTGKNIHVHTDHVEEREYVPNRPNAFATTQIGGGNYGIDTVSSREYSLKPTVNPGGFSPNVGIPTVERSENILTEFDTEKSRMRQRVFEMQQERRN